MGATAACAPQKPAPAGTWSDTAIRLRIEEHLAERLRNIDGAALARLEISGDGRLACGIVTTPGRRPIYFHSSDPSPETTGDRPLAMPSLPDAAAWDAAPNVRLNDSLHRNCQENGLLRLQ